MNCHQRQTFRNLKPLPPWFSRLMLIITVLYKIALNVVCPFRNPSWPWAVFCLALSGIASLAMLASPAPPDTLVQRIYNIFSAGAFIAVILYYIVLKTRATRHLPVNRLYILIASECYIGLSIALAHAAAPIAPQWMAGVLILGVASLLIILSATIASCLVAIGQNNRLIPA